MVEHAFPFRSPTDGGRGGASMASPLPLFGRLALAGLAGMAPGDRHPPPHFLVGGTSSREAILKP
jgi:hypothetical protein